MNYDYDSAPNRERQSLLSFRVAQEMFAISVKHIIEILPIDKITRIPHAPDYISGVTNLRGSVIPVTNLRIKFGRPQTETTPNTCIIVLNIPIENQNVVLGALVDSVNEVFELEPDAVLPPPTIGARYRSELIHGIARVNDELVMILNLEQVFSSDEIAEVRESVSA